MTMMIRLRSNIAFTSSKENRNSFKYYAGLTDSFVQDNEEFYHIIHINSCLIHITPTNFEH